MRDMADPKPVRRSGVLAEWNDERGFGFITPTDGTRRVFAHISEFPKDGPRPSAGDELSFVVGAGGDGRRQALGVEILNSARLARAEAVRRSAAEHRRAPIRWLPIAVVPAFAILFVLVAVTWPVPLWVIVLYPAMSAATFGLYALDKAAALGRGWRTRETTLQLAAVLGGWPGAILAQQFLRHKNRKVAFQAAFWCLVVLNIAILLVIVWYRGPLMEVLAQLGRVLAGG